MCNGISTRTTVGGTIAVLRPVPDSRTTTRGPFDGELYFHKDEAGSRPGTSASFQSREYWNSTALAGYTIVIQYVFLAYDDPAPLTTFSEYGDLSEPIEESRIFAKFTFFPLDKLATSCLHRMELPEPLVLGVGKDGIIGRRLSVFEDETMTTRVAEGIVGWN
jgi:hypothetical protein